MILQRIFALALLAVCAALAVMAVIGAAAPAGSAEVELKMVFVPASDKGDEDDYANLIKIIENQTGWIHISSAIVRFSRNASAGVR